MTTLEKIRADMKESLRAHDGEKTTTLRSLIAACVNELVAKGCKPTDSLPEKDVIKVLKRAVKQRADAAAQFRAGNREELAQKEEREAAIISTYLPPQASAEDIREVALSIIKSQNENVHPGKIIGAVLAHFSDTADGAIVKDIVTDILSSPKN